MTNSPLRPVPIQDIRIAIEDDENSSLGYNAHVFLQDDRVLTLGWHKTQEECERSIREFLDVYRTIVDSSE